MQNRNKTQEGVSDSDSPFCRKVEKMKQLQVVKVGSLKEKDENKRGQVAVRDVPLREIGPEEVKIKVAYCAICGSDPHSVENFFNQEVPFGLGHELSGIVVELGEKAKDKGLKVGDRVAGNFLAFCGTCYYCQNGQEQFCEHTDRHNFPGFSEYVIWHESQVYKLPDTVSLKTGCLLEPISIATRIMDKLDMKFGMRVAICGGGPIGLLTLQSIAMFGASKVAMIEPIEDRRKLALKYGASDVIDPIHQNLQEETDKITDGMGFDVVIDCSGSIHAVEGLLGITAKGGKLLYAAQYPHGYKLPLDLTEYLYFKEITISGVFIAPYAYPRALQMLERYKLDEFTEHVYPLDKGAEAFADQVTGKHVKILIQCNEDIRE